MLLAYLAPGYTFPSTTHLAKIIKDQHTEGKKELGRLLKSEATACSLTTDVWSSHANQAYNTLTCHFVDREWTLVSAVVETSRFPGRHTPKNIAIKVRHSLQAVDLPAEKVFSIVHDEAANAEAAGTLLAKEVGWNSQTCAAHLLQTMIKRSVEESRPVQKLLAQCYRLVSHFRQSNPSTESLLQKERQMDMKGSSRRFNKMELILLHGGPDSEAPSSSYASSDRKRSEKGAPPVAPHRQWGMADKMVKVLKPL